MSLNFRTQQRVNEISKSGVDWHASGGLMAEFANCLEEELKTIQSRTFDESELRRTRDWIAIAAMQGYLASGNAPQQPTDLASWSYEMADAMMFERQNGSKSFGLHEINKEPADR